MAAKPKERILKEMLQAEKLLEEGIALVQSRDSAIQLFRVTAGAANNNAKSKAAQ